MKISLIYSFMFFYVFVFAVKAEDIKTIQGIFFQDVTVVTNRSDETSIYIKHRNGSVKLPLQYLSVEDQKKYFIKFETNSEIVISKIIAETNLESRIGFNGLYIGMNRLEIQKLIANDKFEDMAPFLKLNGPMIMLKGGKSASDNFKSIGNDVVDGSITRYKWSEIHLSFYKDKLWCIKILSDSCGINEFDYEIKFWLQFARKALISKYGQPVNETLDVDSLNVYDIKENNIQWKIKAEQYAVIGCEFKEGKFNATIDYADADVFKLMSEERKINSNL